MKSKHGASHHVALELPRCMASLEAEEETVAVSAQGVADLHQPAGGGACTWAPFASHSLLRLGSKTLALHGAGWMLSYTCSDCPRIPVPRSQAHRELAIRVAARPRDDSEGTLETVPMG